MRRTDIDGSGSLDAAEIMIGREEEGEAVERRGKESKERKEKKEKKERKERKERKKKEAEEKAKKETSSREGEGGEEGKGGDSKGEEGGEEGDKEVENPFFITVEERLTLAVIHRTVGVMDRNGDGKSLYI